MKRWIYTLIIQCLSVTHPAHAAQSTIAPAQMEPTYSAAADTADETTMQNGITMAPWGASAAVCAAACFNYFKTTEGVCTGSAIAAGVADSGATAAVQKSATAALSGLQGAMSGVGGGAAAAGAMSKMSGKAVKESCGTAAMNLLTMAQKAMGMMESQKAGDSAREMADQLGSGGYYGNTVPTSGIPKAPTLGAGSEAISRTSSMGNLSGGKAPSQVCKNTSGSDRVNCVMALDPRLPKNLNSPEFNEAFKQISGMNLGDFLENVPDEATPSQIMAAALGGSGDFGSAGELLANFKQVDDAIYGANPRGVENRRMAGIPGAGSDAGGKKKANATNPFNDIFGKLKDQMGGRKPAAETRLQEIDLTLSKLSPDEIVEKREISLFDRVTLKMHASDSRLNPSFTPRHKHSRHQSM